MKPIENLTLEEIDQRIARTAVEAAIEIGYYLKQIRAKTSTNTQKSIMAMTNPLHPGICPEMTVFPWAGTARNWRKNTGAMERISCRR